MHTLSWRFSAMVWKSHKTYKIEYESRNTVIVKITFLISKYKMMEVSNALYYTRNGQLNVKIWGYKVCKRKGENCEISHIGTTNTALIIYKVEQKILSLCLCVEHREFKVTWTKSGGGLATRKGFWPTKTGPTIEPAIRRHPASVRRRHPARHR